jgi:hypothetical protein
MFSLTGTEIALSATSFTIRPGAVADPFGVPRDALAKALSPAHQIAMISPPELRGFDLPVSLSPLPLPLDGEWFRERIFIFDLSLVSPCYYPYH